MPQILTNEYGDEVVNDFGDPVLAAEPIGRGETESTSKEFAKNLSQTVEQAGIGLTQGFANLGAGANKLLELRQRASLDVPTVTGRVANAVAGNTSNPLAEQFRGAADVARKQSQLLEQTGQETEGPEFARKLASGAVSIVPAIAAGPMGIPAAIAASGLSSFADTFQSAEEAALAQGATPELARKRAIIPAVASGLATAAITAAGGKIAPGVEGFAQSVATKGFKDAAVKIIANTGAEATEEAVDELAQSAIEVMSFNPELTPEQAFERAVDAFKIGGILGGTLSTVNVASNPQVQLAEESFLPATAEVLKGTPPPLPSAEESFAPRVIQPDPNAPIVEEAVNEFGDTIVEPVPEDERAVLQAELDEELGQESIAMEREPEPTLSVETPLTKLSPDAFLRLQKDKVNQIFKDGVEAGEDLNRIRGAAIESMRADFKKYVPGSGLFDLKSKWPTQAERAAEQYIQSAYLAEKSALESKPKKQAAIFPVQEVKPSQITESREDIAKSVMASLRAARSEPGATKPPPIPNEKAQTKETRVLTPEQAATEADKRLGITNPIAASVARQITGTAQKWFTAEGNLPKEVFQGNVERVGKIKEQLTEARYAERDLYSALRKEFKIEGVERLTEDLNKVPKPVIRQMNAVLKGEANPNTLPESLREPLARMRAHVDALSAIMLERGLIDEDLQQIVGDNLGTYLTRSYRVFDDPQWSEKIPVEVMNRARHFILQGLRQKNAAATEREADTLMRSLLEDWRSKGVDKALNQGRLGNKDLTLFMKRKDIAPEIRALMGEYETPVINYMKSVARIARLIADQEFLNQVREFGMGKFLFEDGTQPRGFDTLIAAEGSQTMSPLNGLRTTREIAEAFKKFGKVSSPEGLLKMALAINAVAKGAKTIGSVMTQARNLTGQPFFWAMSGHWDWTPTRAAVKSIGADIGTNDQRAWRERYKEYVRLGIVDDSTQAQELRDAFKDGGLLQEVPTADEFAAKTMRNNLRKLLLNAPARAYQISDELGKIVGFENEVVRQKAIHPDWTEAQVKQEAATRIRNTYPTYSMVPEAVKKWRRQPIFGPFVSFAYETFRTTYWNLRYMQEDLASGNAAQKKAGAQRMAGIAAVMASGYALSILSRALLGIDKKEEDDLRQFLPPWAENSELLFTGKDDKGNLSYLNLSYLNPYSYLTDPFIAAVTNLRNEEGVAKATLESAKEFMSPFINEQIATAAMVDVMRNQTSTGREVYNPQDPDKWKDMAAHLFASVEPGTSQRFRKRIYPSLTGQQTEFGRVLNPTVEVAREVTGLNTETTDFRQAIAFKASEFRKAETLSEDIFRRLATKRGAVEPTEISEAYRKSEQVRFELYQDFFDDIQAARRRGVFDKEIYNAITARGIGKEESRRLLRGVYQPYDVSPQIKARLKDIGRKLPLEDIRSVQKEYRNRAYQVN